MKILDITKIDDKYTYLLLDQEFDKDLMFDWVKIVGTPRIVRVFDPKNQHGYSHAKVNNADADAFAVGDSLQLFNPYKCVTDEVFRKS
jgi:hypothetical protein